jgi:PAS domain S-box-containing protein
MNPLTRKPFPPSTIYHILILGTIIAGLYLTSLYSYLLFHGLAELLTIVVAFSIFIIGWAARRSMTSGYLLFIGVAFLFIGALDAVHTLAFKGMGVFVDFDANLPTQLWIGTRYLQALSFLTALLFLRRKPRPRYVLGGFILVAGLLVVSIFTGIFPVCYIDGQGLTPFKIISEYAISVLLLAAVGLLYRNRQEFDRQVLGWLISSIGMSVLSEIGFTNYISVYGPANLVGHLLKIGAVYCLFQAIVQTGFYRPLNFLLLDLKRNEDALRSAHTDLEKRVQERTQQLAEANAGLRAEIAERERTQRALQKSETRFWTIFDHSPVGIEVIGLDGRILASNWTLQRLLGYSDEELRGMHFRQITKSADILLSEALFSRLASGGEAYYQVEKRYQTKDEKTLWAHLSMALVKDELNQPAFAIGMIENIGERRRMETELNEVKRRLSVSQEQERLRLARELHDGPVQELLAASYHLYQLKEDVNVEGIPVLAGAMELVTQVGQTLRTICKELRPHTLTSFGLEKAIRSHADTLHQEHPEIEIVLDLMPDGQTLPEQASLALFRIYQQAVNNVVRHARASRITVRFMVKDEIFLQIQDNGRGFEVPNSWIHLVREGHLGLAGISERAEEIGGKLSVFSNPGEGTCIQVKVPSVHVDIYQPVG